MLRFTPQTLILSEVIWATNTRWGVVDLHSNYVARRTVMPGQETLKRAKTANHEGKAPTTQAGEFIREEFHHIREGKHGARSPQQAIAIGLSKARRAGVKLPPPKKGTVSERTRRSAEYAYEEGQTNPRHKPSRTRSKATLGALSEKGRRRRPTRPCRGRPSASPISARPPNAAPSRITLRSPGRQPNAVPAPAKPRASERAGSTLEKRDCLSDKVLVRRQPLRRRASSRSLPSCCGGSSAVHCRRARAT